MASFIAIPLKRTNEIDLVKPLKNLFSSYCSSADEPVQFDDALCELNKLRMNCTWRTLDKHESSLEALSRYYDQLNFLDSKCPGIDFQISFKWRDAFDKGTFFSGSASLTLSSMIYEKVCILFNIGAMQSQIAVGHVTDIHNDEGLKLAAKYFQMSAGTFLHLKSVVTQLQHDPTPDLQQDTLHALHCLMLAQAQESFFHKTVSDNMKEIVITKVAAQCEDLYADALRNMQKESTRVLWEKEWLSTIAGKEVGFKAVANYFQSVVCKSKKEVGEEIARLSLASESLKLAEIRGGMTYSIFKDYGNKIALAYNEAKKDNDFIYHARIPDVKSLGPLGKAEIAKPTPVQEKMNPSSQDLFTELLPIAVQQALQAFDVRKNEMLNIMKANVTNQTQLLNGTLASLNLPAAIEDTTGDSLPSSLREKNQEVQTLGGIATLQRMIEELPSLNARNKELIQECEKMLKDEEQSDDNLRAQFKAAWTRTPSSKLNDTLKASVRKYVGVLNTASRADEVVGEKFKKSKDSMEMLGLPEETLMSHIPKGRPVAVCESADQLKRLLDQVNQLRMQRTSLIEDLENSPFDMKDKFLSALSQDGSVNEPALSAEYIGEICGSVQKSIRENLEAQNRLVAEIQRVHAIFSQEQDNKHSTDRDKVLSDLANAYETYMELTKNLSEGSDFYNNFTEILVVFQSKINDFCYARQTEKQEICKDLQTNIVKNASNSATPVAPAHHAESKPARPQPPMKPASAPNVTAPVTATAGSWPYGGAPDPTTAMPPYPTQPVFPYPQFQAIYQNPYLYQNPMQQYPGTFPPQGYQPVPPQGQMPPAGYPYPTQQYQPYPQQQQQWPQQ